MFKQLVHLAQANPKARADLLETFRQAAAKRAKEPYPWDECIEDKKNDPKVDDPEAVCGWIRNKYKTASFAIGLSAAVPLSLRRFVFLCLKVLGNPIPGLGSASEARIRTFGFVVALLENAGYIREARAVNNLLRGALVREAPTLPGEPTGITAATQGQEVAWAAFKRDLERTATDVFRDTLQGAGLSDIGLDSHVGMDAPTRAGLVTALHVKVPTDVGGRDFESFLSRMTGRNRPPDAKYVMVTRLIDALEKKGYKFLTDYGFAKRPNDPAWRGGWVTFSFFFRSIDS